jgi:hypothetical protein
MLVDCFCVTCGEFLRDSRDARGPFLRKTVDYFCVEKSVDSQPLCAKQGVDRFCVENCGWIPGSVCRRLPGDLAGDVSWAGKQREPDVRSL